MIETILVLACIWLATWLRFHATPEEHVDYIVDLPLRAALIAACLIGAMFSFGLYQPHVRQGRFDFALRLFASFVFGGVLLTVLYYLLPVLYVGRGVLSLSLLLSLCAIVIAREIHEKLATSELMKQRVMVYGAGNNAELINQHMRRASDRRAFSIVGFVPVPGQQQVVAGTKLLDARANLLELAISLNIDEIVMAADERRGAIPMEDMLACVQRGIVVTDLSSFFEREAGKVQLNIVDPSWLVFSGGFDYSTPRRISKRLFDLVAASVLTLLTWPLMLITAAIVRLDSPGPVLYRQTRVGEYGRHFEIVKFRSMRCDAERDGVARWASANDDRSTRVGRFIRKTRLDELPQLLMVLRGDMSFVGPRPERPQFVDMLNNEIRYYDVRHSVKPGLTGWAQLRYPYGASVRDADEKLKYDLFYVKNHALLFDLTILMQTVEVVIFGRGAR